MQAIIIQKNKRDKMGATLGHMLVFDYDVGTKKIQVQQDSIDYQASEVWKKANKNCPLNDGQTVIRIAQIMGVLKPEARALGALADQITNLQLKCQLNRQPEHQFDFQATEFPYYFSFKLNGEETQVYIWDHLSDDEDDGKPNDKNGKTYKIVPAGTKLIFDSESIWFVRDTNNFYVETDAVKFAANFASSKFIVLAEDTEMIDFADEIIGGPEEKRYLNIPGYEPTSFVQLAKLIENAQPYAGDDSIQIDIKAQDSAAFEKIFDKAKETLMAGILAYQLAKDPLVEQDPLIQSFNFEAK